MQFQLLNANAKITSLNPRAERHGDDNVPACDIGFELNAHSSVLDYFDPSYRPFLFRSPDRENDQPSLVPGENMTALAKPNLKPLKLDEDFPGYTLRIGNGLDAVGKGMVLKAVNLPSFNIEAIDGGSVKLKFSAACHPNADECGALYERIQDVVELTLEAPKAEAQQMPLGGEGDTLEQQDRAA